MKFRRNLWQVVAVSDPEWAPYWINYKYLKKLIMKIVRQNEGKKIDNPMVSCDPNEIRKSNCEVEFFQLLKKEVKKTNDFYNSEEQLCALRKSRIENSFKLLKDHGNRYDSGAWSSLLCACVQFYKDMLFLENFAIMNYCGFSKILKKHDKHTGYATRNAFMTNIVHKQNCSSYTAILKMIKEVEILFVDIQNHGATPLQNEERIFLEAIQYLNYQASRLRAEEISTLFTSSDDKDYKLLLSTLSTPPNNNVVARNNVIHRSLSASEGLDVASDSLYDIAAVKYQQYITCTPPDIRRAIKWIRQLNVSSEQIELSNEDSHNPNQSEDTSCHSHLSASTSL